MCYRVLGERFGIMISIERTDLLEGARTIEPLRAQLATFVYGTVSGLFSFREGGFYQCLFSLAPGGRESS